jgi:uncharacterized protein
MPTKEQMFKRWETEFEFPETRNTDDPSYVAPKLILPTIHENLDTADGSIRTFTGKYFNVFEPNVDLIDIEDIAHSLAMQCRFNGHTKRFYSVAQHSIWVAERVPYEDKMAALLHDGSEAYLCDIPSPIKKFFTQYHSIENGVMQAIAEKFKFTFPFTAVIKELDRAALIWEWNNKVLNNHYPEENWDYQTAKDKFLQFYESIRN